MFNYAAVIKPILIELDEARALHQPVRVEADLIPLFTKHSSFKTIDLYPIPQGPICGMHLSNAKSGVAQIFYRRCESHFAKDLVASCPECQLARVTVAKELVHVLDSNGARTSIEAAPDLLIDLLLKGALAENSHVQADSTAVFWAIEMLARFQHRLVQLGGPLGSTSALTNAKTTDNWGLYATGYAIPTGVARIAYSDNFMNLAKTFRDAVGLPTICVI
ncbi:hypothetical protein [Sphingobium sp. CFD-1]|uniref:hypothetical protein n=1 Tax=Sphingobium sp. CFD-1 TaxID=2878545 RepID=UPI00214D0DAC|nr:hypothetical protein [Sphingobium sp. CFD-1]